MRRHRKVHVRTGPAPRLHARHRVKRHRAIRGGDVDYAAIAARRAAKRAAGVKPRARKATWSSYF